MNHSEDSQNNMRSLKQIVKDYGRGDSEMNNKKTRNRSQIRYQCSDGR